MSFKMGAVRKTNQLLTAFTRTNFSSSAVTKANIENVVVIGGGLMGSGIAQVTLFLRVLLIILCKLTRELNM